MSAMNRLAQGTHGAILLFGCLSHAAFVLAQSSSNTPDAAMEREFQAAMAAEDAGNVTRAESILTSLHARHPGIFAVDESLGLIYVTQEKYTQALPVLEAAAHEAPTSDAAEANLGAIYYKLHRNQDALKAFEAAARLNPKNAATQQALGELWMEEHEPARAAEAFGAALALNPGDTDRMLDRAQALIGAKQWTRAKDQLAQFPNAENSSAAQSLLGDIDENSGDIRSAAEHYARAVELDPSEPNVWALGVEFLQHWTFDAALQEFEAAVIKFPASTRMKVGLGAAAFGGGDYMRAVSVFAALLDADPNNALYADMLGVVCDAAPQNDLPQCTALITYVQSHPGDVQAAVHAAIRVLKQERTPERMAVARKLLGSAIAADPKLPEAQYRMGLLQQDDGQWQQSISYLEAAVRLNPELAEAHYRLGQAYWRAGRKPEAEAQMDLYRKSREKHLETRDQKLSRITTLIVEMRSQH
jgi:tetratricopeptide (TPR) repeat protein